MIFNVIIEVILLDLGAVFCSNMISKQNLIEFLLKTFRIYFSF